MARSVTSAFAVRRGDHLCITYEQDSDHHDVFAVHLIAALESGEKVVYVTQNGTLREAAAHLGITASEFRSLEARGQLAVRPELIDHGAVNTALEPDRVVKVLRDEADLAIGSGYLGLRMCVDMAAWGVPASHSPTVELERRISALLAAGELTGLALLCHYDLRRLTGEQLDRLRDAHPVVVDAEQAKYREPSLSVTELPDHAGLRLHGEADRGNLGELDTALTQVRRRLETDLHLDMAGLRYADVDALRLIATTADTFPKSTRMILHAPAPIVLATLRIFGWDRLPTLVIEGSGA